MEVENMGAVHGKPGITHHHGALWALIDRLERRLHLKSRASATRRTYRTGRVNREFSKEMAFFKDSAELDAYMQDI